MCLNIEDLQKALEAWRNSGEEALWLEKQEMKDSCRKLRSQKLEKWLESNSFDQLMERLKTEHSKNYRNKCYANGYESCPNNKLQFLFNWLEVTQPNLAVYGEEDFITFRCAFKNYQFRFYQGQGCYLVIDKIDDNGSITFFTV